MIPLNDIITSEERSRPTSNCTPIGSLPLIIITADRYGYCLYNCEISPEDECATVLTKARKAVHKAQNSFYDRLTRFLAPILFMYVIGVTEYEVVCIVEPQTR
jgi:hypothetical protein